MSGTWLQQGSYGPLANSSAPLAALRLTEAGASERLAAVASLPAVAAAQRACPWVVVTALFLPKPGSLMPPATHAPIPAACWLAFVDSLEHRTPGWTAVRLTLFDTLERSANLVKVMSPAVLRLPAVYVDHTLTRARCISLPHLVRGVGGLDAPAAGSPPRPHLYASRIPSWSARSRLPVQLELTRAFVAKSKRPQRADDDAEIDALVRSMEPTPGFNLSTATMPDSMWMVWPRPDEHAQRLSALWFGAVARFSAFEKLSFAWARAQVPAFVEVRASGDYVYSPEQRCKCAQTAKRGATGADGQGGNASKATLCDAKWSASSERVRECIAMGAGAERPEELSLAACCSRQPPPQCERRRLEGLPPPPTPRPGPRGAARKARSKTKRRGG